MSSISVTEALPRPNNDFLEAMRRVTATVSIITTVDGNGCWVGMTASSVTSVSMNPPSLLVCLNRAGQTHDVVKKTGRLCVNVLANTQSDVCANFAKPGPKADGFTAGDWEQRYGLPCLRTCQVMIFCGVARHIVHGTHGIFIANVDEVNFGAHPIKPLVYLNRAALPIPCAPAPVSH